jgi:hypothetical protein
MAKIYFDPLIRTVSGRVGSLVFYAYGNKQYARRYVVPVNTGTPAQKKGRTLFAEAVFAWQNLSFSARDKWNKKCRFMNLSGYNLFISSYILGKNTDSDGNSRKEFSLFFPYTLRSLSVYDSGQIREGYRSPSFRSVLCTSPP